MDAFQEALKKVIRTEDVEVLRELYRDDKVDLYRFHQLYSISPDQLARTINHFGDLKVIEIVGDCAQLTDFGRTWVVANRRLIFLRERELEWKVIPKNMQKERISKDSVYKPNEHLIDREFFQHLVEEKG